MHIIDFDSCSLYYTDKFYDFRVSTVLLPFILSRDDTCMYKTKLTHPSSKSIEYISTYNHFPSDEINIVITYCVRKSPEKYVRN